MNKSIKKLVHSRSYYLVAVVVVLAVSACKKYLPKERETVGPDSQYTIDTYQPVEEAK